jgi:hypothetical protein
MLRHALLQATHGSVGKRLPRALVLTSQVLQN